MRGFWPLVLCQAKLLVRNTTYVVASFGIAFISMVVFGLLFGPGSSSPISLGIVDEDNSIASNQLVAAFDKSGTFAITKGDREKELKSLRSGDRRLVIAIEPGFQQNLLNKSAVLKVYYDQSNIVAAMTASTAAQAIVSQVNRAIAGGEEPIKVEQEGITAKQLRNIDFLTPGLVGMMIMWANMFVGIGLIDWRQRGILKRLGITPLHPLNFIGSHISAHLILSLLQAVVLFVIAALWFNVTIEGSYLILALILVLGALCFLGVGYIIGAFLRSPESANSVTMLISFPMMFLGGSYFPTDTAPDIIQPLVKALPLTYLNHALREIVNNGAGLDIIRNDLLVLLGWMVASLVISTRLFRWQ